MISGRKFHHITGEFSLEPDFSSDSWLDTVLERVVQNQDHFIKQQFSLSQSSQPSHHITANQHSTNQIAAQQNSTRQVAPHQDLANRITVNQQITQHGVNKTASVSTEYVALTNRPITNQYSEMDQSDSNTISSSYQDTNVSSTMSIKDEPTARKRKLLPPCKVCGEKASGLHYGVNTCEACKGFFRRSLSRGENFHCAESWKCEVVPGKRNNCAACRYRKCIAVGMSKDAIKIGRYTHEKRTQDILEVNKIPHPTAAVNNNNNDGSAKKSCEVPVPTHAEVGIKYEALTPPDSDVCEQQQKIIVKERKSAAAQDTGTNTRRYMNDVNRRQLVGLPSIYEQKVSYTLSAVEEVMRYTKSLSQAMMYMKYFFAAAPSSVLSHIVKIRLDRNPLDKEILNTLTNSSQITEKIPVDEDERKELIQHWAESIEETFVVIAQFAKSVPGFKTLPLIDRINLIKSTRSRLLFIASHKRFDIQNKCFIGRFNRVDTFTDIVKIYNNSEFVNGMMSLAEEYLKIRLNDVEWLLVLSICMCCPDEAVWSELSKQAKDRLAAMYSQQLRILDFYLRMNHPHEHRLKEVILAAFNATVERDKHHTRLLGEVREIWKDFYNFPPLFQEIIKHDFRAPLLPRRTPKSPTSFESPTPPTPPINQSPSQSPPADKTCSSKECKRHWKKSKIASILETSEHIDQLMKQAVKRSKYDAAPQRQIQSIQPTLQSNQSQTQPVSQISNQTQQIDFPMKLSLTQEVPSSRTHPFVDLTTATSTFPQNLLPEPHLDATTNQIASIQSSANQIPVSYTGMMTQSNHLYTMVANQNNYVPTTANQNRLMTQLTNQNTEISPALDQIADLPANIFPQTRTENPRTINDTLLFPADQNLLPILSDCYGISSGEPFPETMQSDLDMLIPSPIEHSLPNSFNLPAINVTTNSLHTTYNTHSTH